MFQSNTLNKSLIRLAEQLDKLGNPRVAHAGIVIVEKKQTHILWDKKYFLYKEDYTRVIQDIHIYDKNKP